MSAVQDVLLGESISPFLQHTYTSGSGLETIPVAYTTLIIEVWGIAGGGGAGTGLDGFQGGGGASGSYCRSSYSVTAMDGKTINYSIGAAGTLAATTVSSGTFLITGMTAPAGGDGGNASSSSGLGGSAGGIGTGGNAANVNGTPGNTGNPVGNGNGGKGLVGLYQIGFNGRSGQYAGAPRPGFNGMIIFTYQP